MNAFEILAGKFDFRKNPDICNYPDCENKAVLSFIFKEKNLRLQTEKVLAEIKICDDHASEASTTLIELNKNRSGEYKLYEAEKKAI
jgi:hypothetical protein